MFKKSIPLLKVDATNPPKSVITPPPKLIKSPFLFTWLSLRVFQISMQVSMVLFASPLGISIIEAF